MKDEIKEILDGFKEILDNPTTSDECYDGRIIVIDRSYDLDLDEIKLLLDYITNLQEELKETADLCSKHFVKIQVLKEELKSANESISWWQNRFNAVAKENERLKETNVYCNRTDCIGRIKDSRKYDSVYQEKEDYKSRNEKAIEELDKYINSCEIEAEHTLNNEKCLISVRHSKKVKNILNGGDNNENK